VKIVADSSPLIALAKIDQFALLERLFGSILITSEVHSEVVIAGSGLPGAREASRAHWIQVQPVNNKADLVAAQRRFALDLGELSTFVLAREVNADLVLVDDLAARKLMLAAGLRIQGAVGILEACFARKYLLDLRQAYKRLLEAGVYLDRVFLNVRLKALNLPPL
jgi:predicted nucleic acid-binding protein